MLKSLDMSDKLSQDLQSLKIDRNQKDGDRGRKKWLVVILLAIVAILIAAGVAFIPDTRISALNAKSPEVEVAMVTRQSPSAGNVVLTAGGYIIPRVRVEVSSKTSGLFGRGYISMHSFASIASSSSLTPISFIVVGTPRCTTISLAFSAAALPRASGSSARDATPYASASLFIFGAQATA
jgi:hypothetical protein